MKIIQVNVESGYKLPPLLEFIQEEQPDIICTQEVLNCENGVADSDHYQTLRHIKEVGSFNHCFFSPTWGFEAFGQPMQLGNAIFSAVLLENEQTIFISKAYVPLQSAVDWQSNIRNLQIAKVKIGEHELTIANHQGYLVHKSAAGGTETIQYTQKVADNLRPYAGSMIFCTDLNIIKESPGFLPIADLGLRNLTSEHNIKTTLSSVHRAPNKDNVACDYIFCSKDIKVNGFVVSDRIVSDHKALILDFDI